MACPITFSPPFGPFTVQGRGGHAWSDRMLILLSYEELYMYMAARGFELHVVDM